MIVTKGLRDALNALVTGILTKWHGLQLALQRC